MRIINHLSYLLSLTSLVITLPLYANSPSTPLSKIIQEQLTNNYIQVASQLTAAQANTTSYYNYLAAHDPKVAKFFLKQVKKHNIKEMPKVIFKDGSYLTTIQTQQFKLTPIDSIKGVWAVNDTIYRLGPKIDYDKFYTQLLRQFGSPNPSITLLNLLISDAHAIIPVWLAATAFTSIAAISAYLSANSVELTKEKANNLMKLLEEKITQCEEDKEHYPKNPGGLGLTVRTIINAVKYPLDDWRYGDCKRWKKLNSSICYKEQTLIKCLESLDKIVKITDGKRESKALIDNGESTERGSSSRSRVNPQ
jgi:hypothetical protein